MSINDSIEQIEDALEERKLQTVSKIASELTISEAQTILERLPLKDRAVVFRLLDKDKSIEVFERLDPVIESELFTELKTEEVNNLFNELDPDDRVSLLDELPASIASRLIRQLNPKEHALTSAILGFPQGSIGRKMSPEFIHASTRSTVGSVIKNVRKNGAKAESVYAIPVVDSKRNLVGIASLNEVLSTDDDVRMSQIMSEPEFAYAFEDEEIAARKCLDGGYIVLPVVDKEKKLLGILTIDDAQAILEAAAEEDAARAGATEPLRRPYLSTPVIQVVKSRVVWLLVLAFSALFTVGVIKNFEATLATMTVLASFIPLLTGIGGNTGSQAATTVTRALALHDISLKDFTKIVAKESVVGLMLGVVLGAVAIIPAALIYQPKIALVISLTIICICIMGATVGGAMPLLAKKLGADPAVFSTPFISTFSDATGLIIYFTIAKLILKI